MKRYLYLMIALVLVALLAAPALAQQQQDEPSLGDLSKQNKEKKAAKVLTEDDVKSSSPAGTTSASDENKDKDNEKKDDAAAEPGDNRSDVEKAQDDVKKWTHEEASLKGKLATLEEKAAAEPSEFRRQMYRDAVNNQQTTLGELAQKKADAEKRLNDAKAKEEADGGAKPKDKPAADAEQPKAEEVSPQ